jgi:hypothetical protein
MTVLLLRLSPTTEPIIADKLQLMKVYDLYALSLEANKI